MIQYRAIATIEGE